MPAVRLDAMTVVRVPGARVALSTSSVYPQNCATAFDIAERLGYDGVEVMVWTDPVSQEAGALKALSDLHAMPVVSIHAPTLLLTQRVWGPEAWPKVDNSIELATALGADTVVLHPPFRWQKEYARTFGWPFAKMTPASDLPSRTCFPGGHAIVRSRPTCLTGTRSTSRTTT
jgi:sugar phosphate isomerase/epimerase